MSIRSSLTICACMLMSSMALGAPEQAHVDLRAYKVTVVKGAGSVREQLMVLEDIRPGDAIEYDAAYVNAADQVARNVQLTVPVPAGGLQYAPAASALPPTQASLDGKVFEPLPLMRAHTQPDGRRVMRPVPLSEYRFLRWSLGDLPAGATRSVRARMHLPSVTELNVALAR